MTEQRNEEVISINNSVQSIMIGVAGQLALKQAGIVCAINNDRSSRVVSLEASRHCLIYYSTRSP